MSLFVFLCIVDGHKMKVSCSDFSNLVSMKFSRASEIFCIATLFFAIYLYLCFLFLVALCFFYLGPASHCRFGPTLSLNNAIDRRLGPRVTVGPTLSATCGDNLSSHHFLGAKRRQVLKSVSSKKSFKSRERDRSCFLFFSIPKYLALRLTNLSQN